MCCFSIYVVLFQVCSTGKKIEENTSEGIVLTSTIRVWYRMHVFQNDFASFLFSLTYIEMARSFPSLKSLFKGGCANYAILARYRGEMILGAFDKLMIQYMNHKTSYETFRIL